MLQKDRNVKPLFHHGNGVLHSWKQRIHSIITCGYCNDAGLRFVEPYSLRRANTGNLLLYVYETRRGNSVGGGIKAYKVAKIFNTETIDQLFTPRYVIEL